MSLSAASAIAIEKTSLFSYGDNDMHGGSAITKQSAHLNIFDGGAVRAYDNSVVKAYDTCTVDAFDQSVVQASANVKVKAYDNSRVIANNNAALMLRVPPMFK